MPKAHRKIDLARERERDREEGERGVERKITELSGTPVWIYYFHFIFICETSSPPSHYPFLSRTHTHTHTHTHTQPHTHTHTHSHSHTHTHRHTLTHTHTLSHRNT